MRTMVFLFCGVLSAHGAESGFWQQLSAEERARAGLDALTPVQRAALDELAARYSVGGPRGVPAENSTAAAPAPASVVRPARSQTPAPARLVPESGIESRIGLPQKSDEGEKVVSRIAGEFKGWTGATMFKLENGQVWVQENPNDSQWFKTVMNPSVEINHSMFGGWKLVVDGNRGAWVRVKRVK